MRTKVVDLGCKLGRALEEFRRAGPRYYGRAAEAVCPAECLGVDRQARYAALVRDRGYGFLGLDLTEPGALERLPRADFYLAWDFLEHLPDKGWSDAVLRAALARARIGVWLRMPSFQQDDDTGEGALRALGLRFTWTRWTGHRSGYLIEEALEAIGLYRKEVNRPAVAVRAEPRGLIRSTEDPRVVPADAPVDTVRYEPGLGAKPLVDFDPPLVGQWDLVVTMGSAAQAGGAGQEGDAQGVGAAARRPGWAGERAVQRELACTPP